MTGGRVYSPYLKIWKNLARRKANLALKWSKVKTRSAFLSWHHRLNAEFGVIFKSFKIRLTDNNVSDNASDGNNGEHDQQSGSDADVFEDRH